MAGKYCTAIISFHVNEMVKRYNMNHANSIVSSGSRFMTELQYFFLPAIASLAFMLLADAAEAREIKIGVVADQSSINADIARDYLAGARTYFDHINSQGGIKGEKLVLVVRDDEGDPVKTIKATQELIDVEKVDALFGYVGDAGVAAVADDAGFKRSRIALYAPLSGLATGKTNNTVFYVRPTYRDEARHIIKHFSMVGNGDFMVVATNNNAGETLGQQIVDELNAQKVRKINRVNIATDFRGLDMTIKTILNAKPQVIIMAADTITMAEFVKRFRALDKGINIVGFSNVNHRTLIELAKPDLAASTMLTQVVPHPNLALTPVQREHLTLMAKYRDEPPSHVTLEGFIAAKSFVAALSRAGKINRTTILTALSGERRIDVGGITLTFTTTDDRGSKFVDLAFLRRNGTLIQ